MVLRDSSRLVRQIGLVALGVIAFGAVSAFYVLRTLHGSLPQLEGTVFLAGLSNPAEIDRDDSGVATLKAATRTDLARALGFVHAQERFFQMDLMRRAGAGELSELVGPAAIELDKAHRLHRFRERAAAAFVAMKPETRQILEAYAEGVNAGLSSLHVQPFEYALLRQSAKRWTTVDSMLVVYSMYFALQDATGWQIRRRAIAGATIGDAFTAFLYPPGTDADAAIDGSQLPEPALPGRLPPPISAGLTPRSANTDAPAHGSNAFAVAGRFSSTGSAIVANDMHLDLSLPNIWYRARLVVQDQHQLAGITLPGLPFLIAGSNGHIAWGLTNAYIATGDIVTLDPLEETPTTYQTPDGPRTIRRLVEKICSAGAACIEQPIDETIWGPVVAVDRIGRKQAWRWAAHDPNAVQFDGVLQLERARDVREALDAAHRTGLPQLNVVVGDSSGQIGWTIIGAIPKRYGLLDSLPGSWANGTKGWKGYLAPNEVPEIVNPASGRIWSANNRMIGGQMLDRLGDGGYQPGDRARQIRDALLEKDAWSERDLLAIQLDIRATSLIPWQKRMVEALQREGRRPHLARMLPFVQGWTAQASVDSVGYRLVRDFSEIAQQLMYGIYAGPVLATAGPSAGALISANSARSALRLLTERPPTLVPPPYVTWNDLEDAILDRISSNIETAAGGNISSYTWGEANRAAIGHPLAQAVPLLGMLTDPRNVSVPGDSITPRVQRPGFGASERLVVSPGHEEQAIFAMPGGQAGNPLSEYYLKGHEDWIAGRPSPLLPGPERWKLLLQPS